MQQIKDDVRAFITTNLRRPTQGVDDEQSLLEAGVLDSLGVVALVSYIQDRYDILVSDDDLMPENFDSFAAIAAFVASKQ